MRIATSRFGQLDIEQNDIIRFPAGLLGFERRRQWVLLSNAENDAVVWLQSVEDSKLALALVGPRRVVPDYRIRVARQELTPLGVDDAGALMVLAILGRNNRGFTLNLKGPVLIHPERRLGRQVVANGDVPVDYALTTEQVAARRIA